MDRMVVQASQKSLMVLADSFTCSTLSPFARQLQGTTAGSATSCMPCGSGPSGTYLQHLASVQPAGMHPHGSISQQPTQLPPLQVMPSRGLEHGPHLPQLHSLRTLRSSVGSRLYSMRSTSVIHAPDEPIIVAASWLGARQGPFSKYKLLWQSLGYTRILAARPPMTSIMFPIQGQLLAANFTHKLLEKARAHPKAPILVHLFSGGGFIFMGWVFQLLAELDSPEAAAVRSRIAGVILDSSPAMVTGDVSSRALIAAALGRPAEGIEQQLPWLVRPAAAIVDGYLRLPYVKDALVGMERAWMQLAPPCPKLFLYSEADVLVPPQVVESFMVQQQQRGCQCFSFKWADSAHVDHFRKYPQEYTNQLQQFAQTAVLNWAHAQHRGATPQRQQLYGGQHGPQLQQQQQHQKGPQQQQGPKPQEQQHQQQQQSEAQPQQQQGVQQQQQQQAVQQHHKQAGQQQQPPESPGSMLQDQQQQRDQPQPQQQPQQQQHEGL